MKVRDTNEIIIMNILYILLQIYCFLWIIKGKVLKLCSSEKIIL